jgi:hypothetical protein
MTARQRLVDGSARVGLSGAQRVVIELRTVTSP